MVNRNPYVPPEKQADYLKSSIVNEKPKAPAHAPVARKPAAKKPAAKRK